jgi:hypothetical protein
MGPTQPPVYLKPELFLWGQKRQWLKANRSPPPILELRNAWSYTSAPLYAFMAWTRKTSAFPIYNPYTIYAKCSIAAIEWLG